jgi:hypothetical protein
MQMPPPTLMMLDIQQFAGMEELLRDGIVQSNTSRA